MQSEGGVLNLANCASPPPSPCPRVHQPHLNPSLPAPQTRGPRACPDTQPRDTLSCLQSSSVDPSPSAYPVAVWPMRPCRPGQRAELGGGLQPQGAGSGSLKGHYHWVILRSRSPVLEAPAYLWEWQVGAGSARRPQSLCLSRPRSPYPHPASLGWINGPEPWPGCLALVPCGLWPQAPWACCRV